MTAETKLLRTIATFAHLGGLSGLNAEGAMVVIRRLTIPYFDRTGTVSDLEKRATDALKEQPHDP